MGETTIKVVGEDLRNEVLNLRRELADTKRALSEMTHERDDARESLSRRLELRRELEQALDVGPYMGTDEAVRVALAAIARMRAEAADARADAASWREQCETAREDALRYGRERDEARSLPVMDVCNRCDDCVPTDHDTGEAACTHPKVGERAVVANAAPPLWCPLRGGT